MKACEKLCVHSALFFDLKRCCINYRNYSASLNLKASDLFLSLFIFFSPHFPLRVYFFTVTSLSLYISLLSHNLLFLLFLAPLALSRFFHILFHPSLSFFLPGQTQCRWSNLLVFWLQCTVGIQFSAMRAVCLSWVQTLETNPSCTNVLCAPCWLADYVHGTETSRMLCWFIWLCCFNCVGYTVPNCGAVVNHEL